MWLQPLGFTLSQTQPVCVCVGLCLYVNNTWIGIVQNTHHTNYELDCLMFGPLLKTIGAVHITALVCQFQPLPARPAELCWLPQ